MQTLHGVSSTDIQPIQIPEFYTKGNVDFNKRQERKAILTLPYKRFLQEVSI